MVTVTSPVKFLAGPGLVFWSALQLISVMGVSFWLTLRRGDGVCGAERGCGQAGRKAEEKPAWHQALARS
jgi:hypothetical protein